MIDDGEGGCVLYVTDPAQAKGDNLTMTSPALPGPRRPALVNLIGLWKRPTAYLEWLRARYGKRVLMRLPFGGPVVLISDPADVKDILTAPPDAVHPGEGARILEPILGSYSVILLDEGEHLSQRKLLLPAFHGEKMLRLSGLMEELTDRELDTWPTGTPLALHGHLQRLTLEIILRAVFGLDEGRRLDDLREALTDLLEFSESPLSIMPKLQPIFARFGHWKRFPELIARTDELIFAQIEERRREGQEGRDDVLTMLLGARHEDGSPMSDQELRDELMTALVAGHETTASELAWAFERLARDDRVRARLTAEIEAGESDEYLMATIHEVLRAKPVVPAPEPRLVKSPIEVNGVRYPAGITLLVSAYLLHHDPELYPDPYTFSPERFLARSPGTYTWIPFGGGRRRCLGASFAIQEMKIVLRALLSRFELASAQPTPERVARRSITFSPAGGATVVLRERVPDTPAGAPVPAAA
jgi:cytochrome P450